MIVVSDTSPIRGLIAIGKIDLLKKLFEKVIIPMAVGDELKRIKKIKFDMDSILEKEWIEVKEVQNKQILSELLNHLDQGESEAIILAKEINCNLLLMDENKGRKISKSLNIDTLGLVGILILAKKKGLLQGIKPLIDDLREKHGFWISDTFYDTILKTVNE